MFNKKVVLALTNVIALLLLLKALFIIVIFVWSYVGTPPVVVFDPRASQVVNVLVFIQELGTIAFLYVIAAATSAIIMHKNHGAPDAQARSLAAAPAKRPARRTTRRKTTSKKKS